MAASSRAQVLRLYRALLRESQRFGSYNYRTYAIRRIRDAFRENKNIKDSEKIEELVNKAKANLEVIHRQEAALLSWSHTCPLQHFSGGEEEQGVTPQLETVSVSVSQGLGLGCRSPVPRTAQYAVCISTSSSAAESCRTEHLATMPVPDAQLSEAAWILAN
ncbi:LYR motif-containing protein 4 isoform X3 [Strix aluco]|uniref:LYR motif-containing protein 4 isoform X3 n=1 Tax=Strix aluco TaxID=111821 RepID=UPI003DA617CA